jgi:hypothetical protein
MSFRARVPIENDSDCPNYVQRAEQLRDLRFAPLWENSEQFTDHPAFLRQHDIDRTNCEVFGGCKDRTRAYAREAAIIPNKHYRAGNERSAKLLGSPASACGGSPARVLENPYGRSGGPELI